MIFDVLNSPVLTSQYDWSALPVRVDFFRNAWISVLGATLHLLLLSNAMGYFERTL